jgi:hypothetical protein
MSILSPEKIFEILTNICYRLQGDLELTLASHLCWVTAYPQLSPFLGLKVEIPEEDAKSYTFFFDKEPYSNL